MNIGIICPSEIALRRFMPALQKIREVRFIGVGIYTALERFGEFLPEEEIVKQVLKKEERKAQVFINQYGGKIFYGYETMIKSKEIDAIYIPLPPALHYQWARLALEQNKHVLVEKPATIRAEDSLKLIQLARDRGLALHENYMFVFHNQLDVIDKIIASGKIGDVRLYRISFGFPMRAANDFRYCKSLGGGAFIDAGGYVIKYAAKLLGETAQIRYAQMNYIDPYEVDIYGSAALTNKDGVTAQIAFGMDNNYKCELEVWGSKGCLTTRRVLTAPPELSPEIIIRNGNEDEVYTLSSDDSFKKSIDRFLECIDKKSSREENYQMIMKQAKLVEQFYKMAKHN